MHKYKGWFQPYITAQLNTLYNTVLQAYGEISAVNGNIPTNLVNN